MTTSLVHSMFKIQDKRYLSIKTVVVSKLDDDKKTYNHARSEITNIPGASLFLLLHLNLQFVTFQCKKGYFGQIIAVGHILSNKERGSITIWIRERWNEECCHVKIKVYMSLYSTIFPILCVISGCKPPMTSSGT